MIALIYGLAIFATVFSVFLNIITMNNPYPDDSAKKRLGFDFIEFALDLSWVILLLKMGSVYNISIMPFVVIYFVRIYINFFIDMKRRKKYGNRMIAVNGKIVMPVTVDKCMEAMRNYNKEVSLLFNAVDANKTANSVYIKNLAEYPYMKKAQALFEGKPESKEYEAMISKGVTRNWVWAYCYNAEKIAHSLIDKLYSEKDKDLVITYFKRFVTSFLTFDHAITKSVVMARKGETDKEEEVTVRMPEYEQGGEADDVLLENIINLYKKIDFLNLSIEEARAGGLA